MARPRNTHSKRLAIMLKETELANLQKLADMRGDSMAETLRSLLNNHIQRLKRNGKWEKDDEDETD